MTRIHLLLISFAAIFGSGWLFAPLYATQIAGPAALVAWLMGALMSAIIGITLAEVIVLYPKTGGLNPATKITHGDFLALTLILLNLLVFIILPAIEVRAVLQYLTAYFQILRTSENGISSIGTLLALGLLACITLVNLYGTQTTIALTQLVVFFKLITPIVICLSFLSVLYHLGQLDHSRLFIPLTPTGPLLPWTQIFQAIATSGIIFSFNGFNQATLFAGEAKNPQKAIPFAILGSLLISGLLYLLIQYVFLMAIPAESFQHGWSQLHFIGDQGPFAGIAVLLGLGWLLTIIYADAVISPLGTAFSYASAAPRLLQSLKSQVSAQAPTFATHSTTLTPSLIFLTFFLECVAFIFLPTLKAMISILVAAFVLSYTTTPASLLVLRRIYPHLYRPFRVRFAPLTCFLSLFFSNLMVFSCGWIPLRNLMTALTLLFLCYAFYQGQQLWMKTTPSSAVQNSPKISFKTQIFRSLWFFLQLGALALLSYKHHHQPFSFTLIGMAIAGISLIALLLSQLTGIKTGVKTGNLL